MCLIAWKENIVKFPWFPINFPLYLDPKEWAPSSITAGLNPYLEKASSWIFFILSRSLGYPPQCTNMITLVLLVIFLAKSSRSIFNVNGSISTHLIDNPLAKIGQLEAVQVIGVAKTSSP